MTKPFKILILDGNERASLAVIRCLGKHKLHTIAGAESKNNLASKSKYCKSSICYTSPYLNPVEFINNLVLISQTHGISMIIPITDVTTSLISKFKHKFKNVTIPIADNGQIENLSNKYNLFKVAEKLNLPTPNTHYIDSIDQIPAVQESLSFPAVLKPFKSIIITNDNKILSTSVKIANNLEQFHNIIKNNIEFTEHPFLIQEYIEGHGAAYFVLYHKNQLIADFSHRRIKEKPPSGGVSVLCESMPIDPTMKKYSNKLLHDLGWNGVAMIEFRISKDGTPFLMEVNTRFWGSLQLAIDAGLEIPYILYKNTINKSHTTEKYTYKNGIRLRWLLGELDRLLIMLKSKDYPTTTVIKQLLQFLNPTPTNTYYEINRISDIKPFLYELKNYIKTLFNRK